MMKRFRVALFMAGLLSIGLLSGCSTDTSDEKSSSNGSVSEIVKTLHDGREVTCLLFEGIYKGGISCDWEGATK